ncbi:hypothetical protein D1BOALGB6SA_1471 [Olavius sp. associated proteobacterium Delta 1]|nr:hypothetical protein D1BOALGB6SA_1471 [Olavius sp. associated proteobacterium Delta 1]
MHHFVILLNYFEDESIELVAACQALFVKSSATIRWHEKNY